MRMDKAGWLIIGSVVLLGACGMARASETTPSVSCSSLLKMQLENGVLSEAVEVPAGQPFPMPGGFGPPISLTALPAHCLVHGEVNHHKGADGKDYGDKFEMRLPLAWQGRILFQGGGGLDGILNPALGLIGAETKADSKSALQRGYVVVSSDGGHQDHGPFATDGSFGSDPESRTDYNYLSTKRVMDAARKIVLQFYGRAAEHSYFRGCSNGGREGLMALERYPEYFDGVIAGAPAFNLTHAAIAEAWNTQQLAAIAPSKPNGEPDLEHSLTEADLKVLVHGVLKKCDGLDGLKDGMIFNPEACRFDPSELTCKAGQTDACLTQQKTEAIRKIFDGPHDSTGKAIYSNWPYDAGDAAEGWRVWMTGTGSVPSINVLIFPSFFNGLAMAGVPPKIDIFKFNFDTDTARLAPAAADINADSSDWSGFRKRGGKLLLYTGVSDPVFSALDLIRFYKQAEERNGGETAVQGFARLFLAPGMNHCSGGPGLDDFDTLAVMQDWVENGKAPDSILATGKAFPGRTRPLCAYPLTAMYDGKGNPEDAASFTCRVP
jgi:hypothetical protein